MDKINKNKACLCGSGEKYKKCYPKQLSDNKSTFTAKASNAAIQEDYSEAEMSAIIIEYSQYLLNLVKNKLDQETAVELVIAAWNLSLFPEYCRDEVLATLCKKMKIKQDSNEFNAASYLIQTLLDRKQQSYPNINRRILEHKLILTKNETHLKIASEVYQAKKA